MTDETVTAANVAPVTTGSNRTRIKQGTYGATVTAGQSLALQTDGMWDPADCDASAVLSGSGGTGISLNGGAANQPADIVAGGEYDPGFTATEGVIYVYSGTAGGIAPVGDLGTGDWVVIIGVGNSDGNIDVLPGGPFYSGSQVQA